MTAVRAITRLVDADDVSISSPSDGQALEYDSASGKWKNGTTAAATTKAIAQTAHGFSVGNAVRFNGTSYVKAQADSAADAESVGVVSVVADANNFTLQYAGEITTLTGLTAGEVYFLDPTTAGALTTTEPSTAGQVSKPLLVALSATDALIFNWRGIVVPTGTGSNIDGGTPTSVYTAPQDLDGGTP